MDRNFSLGSRTHTHLFNNSDPIWHECLVVATARQPAMRSFSIRRTIRRDRFLNHLGLQVPNSPLKVLFLQIGTVVRNTCHPRARVRGRAAGRQGIASVGCAPPKLLAKQWAESATACSVMRLLKTRDVFASRTNGGASVVVHLLTSKWRMNSELRGQTVCCKRRLSSSKHLTPPAIARERAAGGHRTTTVGCAYPTLLAQTLAESAAVCRKTSVLKNSRHFPES